MKQTLKLSREDLLRLKEKCKGGDYEAIAALLHHRIAEEIEKYVGTSSDHRYNQGRIHSLTEFFADIVRDIE